MRRLLLLSLLFIACDNQSKEYTDITTSERDIQYYELKERIIEDDNGTLIEIYVPSYLEEHKLNSISTISQFNFFDEDIKMSISLNKLESRNTLNTSSDEYMDAVFYNFEVLWNKDLKKVEEIMPQNLLNDLQVADFNSYLKIDSKKFGERVSYYIDRRLDGTALENEMVTEFHYITHHNKRKYTINISYYGNNSASSFIGLSRSIAGTLKFQN